MKENKNLCVLLSPTYSHMREHAEDPLAIVISQKCVLS